MREEFVRTVDSGDAAALRALLERDPAARALINEPVFAFGSPALVHIAGRGSLALVDVLLEFGADPNRRTSWAPGGWHPLHGASETIANRLIEAGAIPDACAAAHLGLSELLREMLDRDPARVHERGGDGQTPLHFATTRAVADLLLERGADIDARDIDHHGTPAQWMLASRRNAGRYELAAYLVERGASADVFLAAALGLTDALNELLAADPTLLDLRTGQGEYGEKPPGSFHIYTWTIGQNLSPLQVAAQFEQDEAFNIMWRHANAKQRLLGACVLGNAAEAKQQLRAHPGLLGELTASDLRALPDAAWSANAAAVEVMLDCGFDAAAVGANGGTVLHCGAWAGSAACVEITLRYPAVRALINLPDRTYGGTPLSWCCHGAAHCGDPRADHATVARLLLAAGAQVRPEFLDAPPAVARVIRDWTGA